MKKTYIGYSVLAAVLALSAQQANAQQGFGTDKPSKASVVEMTSGSKGLLIPRVALTSLDSFAPVSGEAPTDVDKTDALLVYNTATSDAAVADEEKVTPGYYYWTTDGTSGKWNRLASDADIPTEPWFNQATDTQATLNTQDIYQMANVAVGKTDNLAGTALDVEGAIYGGTGHTGVVGANSAVFGENNQATGANSFSTGTGNIASGDNSVALGAGEGFGNNGTPLPNEAAGAYSMVMGKGNTLWGTGSAVFGNGNQIGTTTNEGNWSLVAGLRNTTNNSRVFILGMDNVVNDHPMGLYEDYLFGARNIANGAGNYLLGNDLQTTGGFQIAIGQRNAIQTSGNPRPAGDIPALTEPVFQVGVGRDAITNRNAMTILYNSYTGIGIAGTEAAAKPTEMLDIGSEGVRIRDINTAAYEGDTDTDNVVVADSDGVLKTVASTSLSSPEPWFNQATDTQATLNTQDIYQMANVAVGKTDNLAGTALDVEGAIYGGTGHTGVVGANSAVFGENNQATGVNNLVSGLDNLESGINSVMGGENNESSGNWTATFGTENINNANVSAVWGWQNEVTGNFSAAWGWQNTVSGPGSLAFGNGNTVSNQQSAAWGIRNTVNGLRSAAWGIDNVSSGNGNLVFGGNNTATNDHSATWGIYNIELPNAYLTIGNGTSTNRANALVVMEDGSMGVDIDTAPSQRLDVGTGNVRIREINANNGSDDDRIVVADEDGVLKTLKAAMPKFFYMPSIIIPTSEAQMADPVYGGLTGDSFDDSALEGTIDLYARYNAQFGTTGTATQPSSPGAPELPVLPASELHYYITWYDTTVFSSVAVDANGVMTYELLPTADVTMGSFMNIVFAVKEDN